MENDKSFNAMQSVKRQFFAMRNGVIADTLRRAGSPFRIIFGLNLPQIVDIARNTGIDSELAQRLWENNSTRESMLLAPMIMGESTFGIDTARRWIAEAPSDEVTDILCHRLLRHMDYAPSLVCELDKRPRNDRDQYTALRLAFNIVAAEPELALKVAQSRVGHSRLGHLAAMLTEEAHFHLNI